MLYMFEVLLMFCEVPVISDGLLRRWRNLIKKYKANLGFGAPFKGKGGDEGELSEVVLALVLDLCCL